MTLINAENKGPFVSELTDKSNVQSYFLVKEKVFGTGKNGKNFLSLQLADRTGSIDARVWDNAEAVQLIVQTGDVVLVKGLTQLFQSRMQLVVHKIEKVTDAQVDAGLLVSSSRHSPDKMLAELVAIVESLPAGPVRELLTLTLGDERIVARLKVFPAAKTIHHAYQSGLLEHILSIAKLMNAIHSHYESEGVTLDRALLIFGAIYHDIGKIFELEGEGPYGYSDRGRLLGHMALALEMIDEKSKTIAGMDTLTLDKLKHIVLSHHGKLEYGSPKEPMFIEAMVVAMIDDFDSKVAALSQFIRNEKANGAQWSRLHPQMNRYILLR